jgi:hypothetical protein
MFDVPTALRWDYNTMRLAAAREAVLSLGLLVLAAEVRIYGFLEEGNGNHPSARCTAWRKSGEQMSPADKKAAGIRANAFYSVEAYAELSEAGRGRPMDAHDKTLLRAQFTVFRYMAVINSREVVKSHPDSAYKHETLHMKCVACNAIDGLETPADEIALFPPDGCTCETANYSVSPHIDWLAGVD